jgi:hypothetical protein
MSTVATLHKRKLVIDGVLHYRCSACGKHFPSECFYAASKGDVSIYCKPCHRARSQAIYLKRKARKQVSLYSSTNSGDQLSEDYLDAVARMHDFSRKTSLSFRGAMIVAIDTFIALHQPVVETTGPSKGGI